MEIFNRQAKSKGLKRKNLQNSLLKNFKSRKQYLIQIMKKKQKMFIAILIYR